MTGQWQATVARRTYITGGQGSQHQDEGLGEDWALTPDRAYSETCAAIASVMVSWRLLLSRGDSRHADLIERTLFNVIATSPSWTGDAFYYSNTLHQRNPGSVPPQDEVCPRASSSLRAPWFAVSCCPTNVARTLASLAAYTVTVDDDGVQLHQYAPAQIRTTLADGRRVTIDTRTRYPEDGVVAVQFLEDTGGPLTLSLRIPAWAHEATVSDQPLAGRTSSTVAGPGTATVTRDFKAGDLVVLTLPMAPRLVDPGPAHRRRPRLSRRRTRPRGPLPRVGRPRAARRRRAAVRGAARPRGRPGAPGRQGPRTAAGGLVTDR